MVFTCLEMDGEVLFIGMGAVCAARQFNVHACGVCDD